MRHLAFAFALALAACGGETESSVPAGKDGGVPPAEGCAPGEATLEDGSCEPAGLPSDAACAPGEWARDDGTCVPAGVPPEGCSAGFLSDGKDACEAVLPDAPCPSGQMAVPGETTCHEVAPCGAAPWGAIPVDAATEYVDAAYAGGGSDGSAAKPWTTIGDAALAAAPGAIVAIAAGSYAEDVVLLNKAVRLWGRCPGLVEIVGVGSQQAAVNIGTAGADGAELHDLAVRGVAGGVGTTGTQGVALSRVWIHDTGGFGAVAGAQMGASSLSITGTLIEATAEVGVFVAGSAATVEGSVVRDTAPNAAGKFGRGISIQDASTGPADVSITGSLIERNHDVGVFVAGSVAEIGATLVRDTEANAVGGGRGILAQPGAGPSDVTVSGSVFEGNHEAGIFLQGSDAVLENTTIGPTEPGLGGDFGRGVEADQEGTAPCTLSIRTSTLRQNRDIGLLIQGCAATIDGTVVRDTAAAGTGGGRGIEVQPSMTGTPGSLTLRSSRIEANHRIGLDVGASSVEVDASLITRTLPDDSGTLGLGVAVLMGADLSLHGSIVEKSGDIAVFVEASTVLLDASVVRDSLQRADGSYGRGVQAQAPVGGGAPSSLTLQRTRVERMFEASLVIVDSALIAEDCVVSGTSAHDMDGLYGDGLVAQSQLGDAIATLTHVRIEKSARAAISSFGSTVTLASSHLVCQAFDLDGEKQGDRAFSWVDLEGNACGCPDPTTTCLAVTSSLAPPPAAGEATP